MVVARESRSIQLVSLMRDAVCFGGSQLLSVGFSSRLLRCSPVYENCQIQFQVIGTVEHEVKTRTQCRKWKVFHG